MSKNSAKQMMSLILLVLIATLTSPLATAGTIGGGNQGRCEMLENEQTKICEGKGKNRTCTTIDSYCGGMGSTGTCSCVPDCADQGNCCADFAPVCQDIFGGCTPDSDQIAFLHVGGMCSTQWDYADDSDRVAEIFGIEGNAASVEVKAVQTSNAGTQVAAKTLTRYLNACCTDTNSCVIYNYSNGDNVVGYALDKLPVYEEICTGKGKKRVCEQAPAWNILEVRTAAGAGGGSELSEWGGVADLFACDLASELTPSKVRNLYDHSNTMGVPIRHIGGFLDEVGSDDSTLNAAWWLLPWHSDGAVAYHSAGARTSTVEWCGDYFFPPLWCSREDICDTRYGALYQGHSMAFCGTDFRNSDHYDQKMEFIRLMGQ